jgi:preprotein translocase subunit SecA
MPRPDFAMMVEAVDARIGRDTVAQWYDQPIRRMPAEIEEQVQQIVIDVVRIFRDRQLMLQQLDGHWIRHLTDLDMLREGINLRAIGQQKPIVAYQKEAYETYQEMLQSVQTQIVRSLFLLPPQQRRPASPTQWGGLRGGQPRQPVLRTSGGSDQATSKPMPVRTSTGGRKLGRNDPCFCGSGKKYKDCHLKSDQRANIVRRVKE